MSKWFGRAVAFGVVLVGLSFFMVGTGNADTLKSSHYQFEETDLGSGGLVPSSSNNYKTTLSVGDPIAGNASSNSYQFEAGSQTTKDPTLDLSIDTSNTNFGSFSSTAPTTATATFSVEDYTSYGYIVQIIGTPPKYANHTIPAMSSPGVSSPGTEQFGINLVKNTNLCGSGCDVGADPDYGQFGAATAKPTTNYDTANTFYYSNGDTIAESPKSSGKITYTLTFLINVSSLTPGGSYTSNQQIICTGTY